MRLRDYLIQKNQGRLVMGVDKAASELLMTEIEAKSALNVSEDYVLIDTLCRYLENS